MRAEGVMNIGLARGATRKIVQLVGEDDRQFPDRAPKTFSQCLLYGTDVGAPLDFGPGEELRILFGDAWTGTRDPRGLVSPVILKHPICDKSPDEIALAPPYHSLHPFNADPVGIVDASVTADSVGSNLKLKFMAVGADGYATLEVPGVSLLTNAVPTGAINTPNGVFVFVTGRPFVTGGSASGEEPQRSWVARWTNLHGTKLDPPVEFSRDRFANFLWPVIGGVGGVPGHPTDGQVVWLWGTGFPNRNSSVRLAYAPLASVGNRKAWRFFTGVDSGEAGWHDDESRAVHLFENSSVGEFSVTWIEPFRRWVMLYTCPDPRGVVLRWAENPWGPWAEGILILHPWADNAYGHFMHAPGHDRVSDPTREDFFGGEYAPIIIPRFTLARDGVVSLRYMLSTWNPYTVVLMETELRAFQADWRFCRKCQGLFFVGNPGKGVCPADDQPHDASQSGKYVVTFGESASASDAGSLGTLSARQGGWRYCPRCQGMFFSPNGAHSGQCPARSIPIIEQTVGGPHHRPHDASASGHYAIFFDDGLSNLGQQNWRFCHKCQGLFFFGDAGGGVCPADHRPHDASRSGRYQMQFEPPPAR
jgi:hypothetical protein